MEHPQIRKNISLRPYNTFGINATAQYFAAFHTVAALEEVLHAHSPQHNNFHLVLGGGSNVLLTRDIEGLVLRNEIDGIDLVDENKEHVFLRVGAGVNWHNFVLYCIKNNYAGVENLSLIPGNVGASPMQNIGAYGVEIKDVFHQLEAYHLLEKKIHLFSASDCGFGYRESVFKNKYKGRYIITSVTYRLDKKPTFHTEYGAIKNELEKMGVNELSIQAISEAVINIRSSKLPDWKELGNAGSFFKNPQVSNEKYADLKAKHPNVVAFPQGSGTKLAAGWLIEQCGWKGYRKGDAGCYHKQALVLVNYGNAKGSEIYNLSTEIIQSVEEKFGVSLEREVNVI